MKIDGSDSPGARQAQPPVAPKKAEPPPSTAQDKELWKACQNFEALFMGYLVKSMEKTLPQGALASSGMTDFMFHQVMGSAISEGGGIGLAEILYRDLQSNRVADPAENGEGISLKELLTSPVRKEDDDETSRR